MKIGSLVKIINNDMSLCFPKGSYEKSKKFFDSVGLVVQLDSDLTKVITSHYKYWHIVLFSAGIAIVREDILEVVQS